MFEEFVDVVVIGSGFGGAVTACRVAQAGRKVLVLERGRLYRPGEFPRDSRQVVTDSWDPSQGVFGPLQVWPLRHVDVIVPSAVGGGSMIGATAMVRMPEECFATSATDWPLEYSDIAQHYGTVEKMMIAEPAPDFGDTDGTEDTPNFYLAQAQRWGAEIRPLHEVKRITAIAGGYALDYLVHRPTPAPGERGSGQPPALARLKARTVVLAAGALGSSWLLLTNRPGLPHLSGQLGTRFSGADDALGFLTLTGGRLGLHQPTNGSRRHLRDAWTAITTRWHRTTTTRPVGGCPMGRNPGYGVVDQHGEAFGHPGLFIADGSVLPAPVGVNPSLTITALAERFAEKIAHRS